MADKCPECGRSMCRYAGQEPCEDCFEPDTPHSHCTACVGPNTIRCLRNQLAAKAAEIERLKIERLKMEAEKWRQKLMRETHKWQ